MTDAHSRSMLSDVEATQVIGALTPYLTQRCRARSAGACVYPESDLEALPVEQPLCLVSGSEHAVLSDEAKTAINVHSSTAMHGVAESFYRSASAALARPEIPNAGARQELTARDYAPGADKGLLRAVIAGLGAVRHDG